MGNVFKNLISLITYRREKEIQNFYIPEENENSDNNYSYDSFNIKNDFKIPTDIDSNIKFIEQEFHYPVNKDIIVRKIKISGKYDAFIAYFLYIFFLLKTYSLFIF